MDVNAVGLTVSENLADRVVLAWLRPPAPLGQGGALGGCEFSFHFFGSFLFIRHSGNVPQHRVLQPEPDVPGDLKGDCGRGAGPQHVINELDEIPHGAALRGHVAGEPGQMPAGDAAQDQEIVERVQDAASANSCASSLSFASFAMQMGPKPFALESGFFRARWHLRQRISAFRSHSSDMPESSDLRRESS